MNDKTIVIYSQKLAGKLMYNGFRLVNIMRNNDDTHKYVFIFMKSDELQKIVDEYTSCTAQ